jgi:hypothetical protein
MTQTPRLSLEYIAQAVEVIDPIFLNSVNIMGTTDLL